MPAYVVAMMTISDPETYREYTDRTPATVAKHGGRFLTRGQDVTSLEGEYTGRLVILEFPTKADVDAWFADPGYQAAKEFRHASSTMHHLLVQEGADDTRAPDPEL